MAGYTQRKKDRDVPLKGIGYVAGQRDAIAQEENESWQRSLQMANMAAKMDPYTSLGLSLGQLLFSNAGKWFGGGAGGRDADGTKSGAENIDGANPGLNLDPNFASAAGLNPDGSTNMNQFGWNGQDARESIGWQPKQGIDDFQFQPLIDSEFNPVNADNWRKKNGITGFFSGLRMGGY